MNILSELNALLRSLGIAVETGIFSGEAPDEYLVITPMSDTFEGYADNMPQYETQEARLSLYSIGNYQQRKNQIVRELLGAGYQITDRRFLEHEPDTDYFHYVIDVAGQYILREE